jgi:CubicO group peptidase (beta-lactamase class C family)
MKRIFLLILFFIYANSFAQSRSSVSTSKPEIAGMSSGGIQAVNTLMQKYVDEKKLPGIITMISRHGKVVSFEKFGLMSPGKPMQYDAIFRIASMTKPIASTAVMILYDENRFQLDDPVSMYIPEFKDLKVFSGTDKNGIKLEEQTRPMTIRQLLMHTSGLASGTQDNPVDSMYRAADLSGGTLKDMVQKLSNIPLLYQPGTKWNYGRSTDVLSYLVEVISGKPFDIFLQERIFKPLQMEETVFSVPEEKMDRIASVYCPSESGGIQAIMAPEVNNLSEKVTFLSGNTGLISTIKDYMIFAQMLLNKGEYNGIRILKPETVELMASNHISDEIMPDDEYFKPIMSGMGFGLGFAVLKESNKPNLTGSAGSYWWSGTANTYFYIDPQKDFFIIFMTQFVPNFHYPVFKEFRELVYRAIID